MEISACATRAPSARDEIDDATGGVLNSLEQHACSHAKWEAAASGVPDGKGQGDGTKDKQAGNKVQPPPQSTRVVECPHKGTTGCFGQRKFATCSRRLWFVGACLSCVICGWFHFPAVPSEPEYPCQTHPALPRWGSLATPFPGLESGRHGRGRFMPPLSAVIFCALLLLVISVWIEALFSLQDSLSRRPFCCLRRLSSGP